MLQKFVFVHIPKTGGTTLKFLFRDGYYRNKFFLDQGYKSSRERNGIIRLNSIDRIKKAPKKNHALIWGHFTVNKYKNLKYPKVTFLRDPLERAVSHYSSWMLNSKSKKDELTFKQFIDKYMLIYDIMCGGDIDNFDFIGITENFNKSVEKLGHFLKLDLPKRNSKINITRRKLQITKSDKKYFLKYYQADIDLYNKALERLEKIK